MPISLFFRFPFSWRPTTNSASGRTDRTAFASMMAQTSDFLITVHGKSAHASTPQMGIDAIVVSAELITMRKPVRSSGTLKAPM